jgi:hypothetical protein
MKAIATLKSIEVLSEDDMDLIAFEDDDPTPVSTARPIVVLGPDDVPRRTGPDAWGAWLSMEAEYMARFVDGNTTVLDLVCESPLSEGDTLAALRELLRCGIIEIR